MPDIPVFLLSITWNRRSQRHKHHSCHSVSEADSAAKVWRQISNDSSEEANDADGHQEAGPTIPVLCGWNAGKQNLPENGEKVHDVIITGGKAVPSTFLIIVAIALEERNGRIITRERSLLQIQKADKGQIYPNVSWMRIEWASKFFEHLALACMVL